MYSNRLFAALTFIWAGGVAVPPLIAQDVTVTPLQWIEAPSVPTVLPAFRSALWSGFPTDLRNTPDFGYVVIDFFVNEKGERLSTHFFTTLPAYEIALRESMRDLELTPGSRAGQPVNALTRCTVIFNPASADAKRPEATPRLLEAYLVVDPSLAPAKNEKAPPPMVVWVTVTIDPAGRPVAVKDAGARANLFLERIQTWRFAAARHAGLAVEAEVRLPLIVVAPRRTPVGDAVPPRLLEYADPVVPVALRASGVRGEVVVGFTVDARGNVTNAVVRRSLNPDFDQAALDAIYRWKYEPAHRDGRPFETHMEVTLRFAHPRANDGGSSGSTVDRLTNAAELPPEFRYDIAPKPRGSVLPVYPYALLQDEVRGKARVRFVVGPDGHVGFTHVLSADRPEFGAALQAAVECYEFEPALKDGRPAQALLAINQDFSNFDHDRLITHQDRALFALETKHPDEIAGAEQLDAKLRPISRRAPVFPHALATTVPTGRAVVELLIDKDGHARLPRMVSASDPAFGWAAVQAVSTWRFDPPTRGGKPVVVRVRVPFEFSGPAPRLPHS